MFDELYNDTAKKNQMELYTHYWDFQKNVVVTRFYRFDFLRKSSAKGALLSWNSSERKNDTNLF